MEDFSSTAACSEVRAYVPPKGACETCCVVMEERVNHSVFTHTLICFVFDCPACFNSDLLAVVGLHLNVCKCAAVIRTSGSQGATGSVWQVCEQTSPLMYTESVLEIPGLGFVLLLLSTAWDW